MARSLWVRWNRWCGVAGGIDNGGLECVLGDEEEDVFFMHIIIIYLNIPRLSSNPPFISLPNQPPTTLLFIN